MLYVYMNNSEENVGFQVQNWELPAKVRQTTNSSENGGGVSSTNNE